MPVLNDGCRAAATMPQAQHGDDYSRGYCWYVLHPASISRLSEHVLGMGYDFMQITPLPNDIGGYQKYYASILLDPLIHDPTSIRRLDPHFFHYQWTSHIPNLDYASCQFEIVGARNQRARHANSFQTAGSDMRQVSRRWGPTGFNFGAGTAQAL